MDRFDGMYYRAAIAGLQEMHSGAKSLYLNSLTASVLDNSAQLVVLKRVEADGLRSDSIVLSRANNGHASFEPVLFHRYEELNARAKLLLAFRVILIEKVTGIVLTRGRIILGRQFTSATIPLSALTAKAERIMRHIKELAIQHDPAFSLCSHCEICEFQTSCRTRAIKEDNISQLHAIGRAHIEEQKKKGIFTLHQYSHTFRPRRLPKRVKKELKQRYFSLQAQALRDRKLYIYGSPTLPLAETSIYFDIEGIPGRRFQYLFGMLIVTEAAESFKSFLANDKSEQSSVLVKFLESLSSYSNATLFHYGNYERKALKDIRQCIGHEHALLVDRILGSSINVLTILHRHCYFPTYSNRLKDIAGFLGYKFNNSVQSGIRSIIFRERWEETADHVIKDELISYNKQDCQALKTVCEFVRKSTTLASAGENIPGRDEKVHFAESLRKVGEGNRPIFRKAKFACPEFEIVNKCAYFDYQRDRVFARTQRLRRRSSPSRTKRTQRRLSLSTDISAPTPDRCSTCGSMKMVFERTIVRWQIDLKYYKTGIGVKKWQPRYLISRHRCLKCNETMYSPDVSVRGRTKYGHGLMCWCVYHNIVAKQSMLSVFRGLKDIFDLDVGTNDVYRFKSTLSSYYNDLSKEILAVILKAGVVHIDETPVKLKKTIGYVWVISSATEVCYLFRESREGSFLQELLGNF